MKERYQLPEREVNFQNMIWQIIYSWRAIIISAIVCAVLFGGIKYAKDVRSAGASEQTTGAATNELEKKLSDEQSDAVNAAKSVKSQLESKRDYKAKSVLMNLDPYKENVVTLQYYVNTNYVLNLSQNIKKDSTSDVVGAYISFVKNKGVVNAIGDTGNGYINEQLLANSITDSSAGNFVVYVIGKNEEDAEKLADKVDASIQAYQSTVADKIIAHELTLVERHASLNTDNDLATKQLALNASISDLKTQLSTLKAGMTSDQLKLLDKNSKETSKAKSEQQTVATPISKKYVVFGILIGIFLSSVWIAFCFVIDGKINSARELQQTYGLRILGEYADAKNRKKRVFQFVDNWLDRLNHKETWTEEEQKALILTNIGVTCKKENVTKVFVTTSLHLDESDKQLVNMFLKSLEAAGLQTVFGENIMRNAKSLEQMSEIGTVILVEKEAYSAYSSLERELSLCSEQKAEVLGVVVIK